MATASSAALLLCILLLVPNSLHGLTTSSPYLSATTLFLNYEKMIETFKIFVYSPQSQKPLHFPTLPLSLFHNSLVNSPFVTQDPNEAHLFYIPFSPDLSTRSIARLIRQLRNDYPYWNRTLGADHFFVSPEGIDYSSDRNTVELKKNSVQISIFPVNSGNFVPHKDITLPLVSPSSVLLLPREPVNQTVSLFCYMKWDGKAESNFVDDLKGDPDFVVESEPLDHLDRVKISKFCLFLHDGDVSWLAEAMAFGCAPVMLVDRPIQDLPLMDVLQWSEMAMLVGTTGGARRLKAVLGGVGEEVYQQMRRFSVVASQHLLWNSEPQPHDAFHMVMYQLWLRRHTIRYVRRESV